MRILRAAVLPLLLLTTMSYAQQDQQAAPPPTNQSSYPADTHKMTPAEKKDTPTANGQPVDLNSASKQDLAALLYESLLEFKLPIKDKTVLLKPNLVGLDPLGRHVQQPDLARLRGHQAGAGVEHGRLAGAVRTNDGTDLADLEVHIDRVDGDQRTEAAH